VHTEDKIEVTVAEDVEITVPKKKGFLHRVKQFIRRVFVCGKGVED